MAKKAWHRAAVRIACIDKTHLGIGVSLHRLTAALQECYDAHFLPVWGYPVRLYVTDRARPTDWQFLYFDTAKEARTLGFHDITRRGQPITKVFVQTSLKDGDPISVTARHELIEMAMDPVANLWAQAKNGMEYAYEVCDPVEEDRFECAGFPMCSFVYPSWFEPFRHPRGTKFDHLGKLSKPFSVSKGGYVVEKRGSRMKYVFGSLAKAARFKQEDRAGRRSSYRRSELEKASAPSRLHRR
jgi:hypothetical protein